MSKEKILLDALKAAHKLLHELADKYCKDKDGFLNEKGIAVWNADTDIKIIEAIKIGEIDKKIRINDYLRFIRAEKGTLTFEQGYKSGYWNVFKYSPELESFLTEGKYDFKIEETNLVD